ncbi:MAG: lysophospholipase [candidate division KSB1 bacterium]|nr:lysophospholipase [candidate division KSB1 bacterium]MDZ7272756.1 lysophospholipase [candidate division KSB1 bacterium]MDZ7284220.1 lysophospholipase [candidate division KSB1 bacterium]MDZ7297382.1 lysophospholipase [candidate division KSB1 bacterium]MDZ7308979.1 lysophospholipase [candidate division KSB1 bacterium]
MKHETGAFDGRKQQGLFYQCWLPGGGARAVLVVVHGLAEHSGRYLNLVDYFVPRGLAVYAFDQQGHGRSPGRRAHIASFGDFVDDLEIFCGRVRRLQPGLPCLLVGHSMGGTIALAYAVSGRCRCEGLILSAPGLKSNANVPPLLMALSSLLSRCTPTLRAVQLEAAAISRDPQVVAAYENDPLVFHGKITARLGRELLDIMTILEQDCAKLALPLLILHGTADRLTDPAGSQNLLARAAAADKTLKLYPGFYHELFNEPGKETVFADMAEWLEQRIPAA